MSSPYINVLIIRSKDLIKAKEFYKNIGLNFIYHQHDMSPEHLVYRDKGVIFEIYPLVTPDSSDSNIRLGFKVDSIDSILQNNNLNKNIVSAPKVSRWGYVVRLKDPDNNLIDLFESEL